jgi:hypothetical protein
MTVNRNLEAYHNALPFSQKEHVEVAMTLAYDYLKNAGIPVASDDRAADLENAIAKFVAVSKDA